MKKLSLMRPWRGRVVLGAISIFIAPSTFAYTCGIDSYGFVYTCCAQYKCMAGIGVKCSVTAPSNSGVITGYTTPMWMKNSACTTSPGWQASTVCGIPFSNSLVTITTPCPNSQGCPYVAY